MQIHLEATRGAATRQDEGVLETPLQNHERKHAHKPPLEVLPQKGKHDIKILLTGKGKCAEALPQDRGPTPKALPPERKLGVDMLLQGSPKEGKSKCDAPLQRDPNKGALATWDPGGKPPIEDLLKLKGPVEAKDIAPGIVAHKKIPGYAELNQSASTIPKSQPRTFIPFSIRHLGLLSSRSPFVMFSS